MTVNEWDGWVWRAVMWFFVFALLFNPWTWLIGIALLFQPIVWVAICVIVAVWWLLAIAGRLGERARRKRYEEARHKSELRGKEWLAACTEQENTFRRPLSSNEREAITARYYPELKKFRHQS